MCLWNQWITALWWPEKASFFSNWSTGNVLVPVWFNMLLYVLASNSRNSKLFTFFCVLKSVFCFRARVSTVLGGLEQSPRISPCQRQEINLSIFSVGLFFQHGFWTVNWNIHDIITDRLNFDIHNAKKLNKWPQLMTLSTTATISPQQAPSCHNSRSTAIASQKTAGWLWMARQGSFDLFRLYQICSKEPNLLMSCFYHGGEELIIFCFFLLVVSTSHDGLFNRPPVLVLLKQQKSNEDVGFSMRTLVTWAMQESIELTWPQVAPQESCLKEISNWKVDLVEGIPQDQRKNHVFLLI